jgi:hypothetical protein
MKPSAPFLSWMPARRSPKRKGRRDQRQHSRVAQAVLTGINLLALVISMPAAGIGL